MLLVALGSATAAVAAAAAPPPPHGDDSRLGGCPYGKCWTGGSQCTRACGPGFDQCGPPSRVAPTFHIHDKSCPAGDTDFPFWDPRHGVYHVMYQDAVGGKHPTHTAIGHVVSRDMIRWAHMGVALWPDRPYDSSAVFTGSATVVDGRPFLIYPGVTIHGFNYAMAVPANSSDPLLTNWTKDKAPTIDIATNPIVTNTSDDPSTAWYSNATNEWRFLANGVGPHFKNSQGKSSNSSFAPIFAASNFTGKWRYVSDSNMLAGECGSLFPLPSLYPGTSVSEKAILPTHVHKRGCGPGNCASWGTRGDHMTLGTWTDGSSTDQPGTFVAAGPERVIDQGQVYAGKDFDDVPNKRRIFFGWATTPSNPQTLARVVTYHPQLKQLVFSPTPECEKLHRSGAPLAKLGATPLKAKVALQLVKSAPAAADWNVSFARPKGTATIGVTVGLATAYVNVVDGESSALVGIYDGGMKLPSPKPDHSGKGAVKADQLQLLPSDEELTMRVFVDADVLEVYWMDGRVVITSALRTGHQTAGSEVSVFASVDCTLISASGWEMQSIWVEPAEVLATPRQIGVKTDDDGLAIALQSCVPRAVDLWSAKCNAAQANCWKDTAHFKTTADPQDCCAKCRQSAALCNGFTHKNTTAQGTGYLCLLKLCSAPSGAWASNCPTTASSLAYPTLSSEVDNPSPPPPPIPSSLIQLDPWQVGPRFDGLGGVSAGTGPRLLVDYPPAARAAVLDFLFLPNFGASLQLLKVEIGGGGDSTQGTEASHEPERGELHPLAGYELWVAAEAKKRNPDILVYGLCWNFPSWVINAAEGFGAAGARYMVDWVEVAAKQNLTVDVLGSWQNEHSFNSSMVVGLRQELDRRGFQHVQLAVGEMRGGQAGFGEVPLQIGQDPALDAATSMVALHYATEESSPFLNISRWRNFWSLKQPLWATEDYSSYSDSQGGRCLAKLFNRNYVDANITATLVWDLFWASFDGLACSGQGMIWSAEPWTEQYGLPDTIWAAAHTTQFSSRNWSYIAKHSGGGGYLPGRLPGTTGGTWTALVSPDAQDLTLVFETMDNNGSACAPGNAGWHVATLPFTPLKVCIAQAWCSARVQPPVFTVFRTDVARGQRFVQLPENVTTNASCCFDVNLTANSQHTFSTKVGAKKGVHPGATVVPVEGADSGCGVAKARLAAPFPLPFSTNFSETDRFRDYPKYLSDIDGVYRVVSTTGGGNALRQQMLEPSSAFGGVCPTSVLGDKSWAAVSVVVEATLPTEANATDYVAVVARIGHGYLFGPPGGYALQLAANGKWQLLVHPTRSKPQRVLASGSAQASLRGTWHQLRLVVAGSTVTGFIDGSEVGRGIDNVWSNGLVGLGSGFHNASYRYFSVAPVATV